MLRDEPLGKKTGLVEQGAVTGTQGKKDLWKKGLDALEDYKDVVRLCRKVRKVKPQLEINLATAEIDKKVFLLIHQQQKESQGENLHPLLHVRGSIATKDGKKAEVLDAFFASVFNSQSSCPWEDRDKEQNEEGGNSDLLLRLSVQRSLGSDGIHPSCSPPFIINPG